jgi:hypothetical protein
VRKRQQDGVLGKFPYRSYCWTHVHKHPLLYALVQRSVISAEVRGIWFLFLISTEMFCSNLKWGGGGECSIQRIDFEFRELIPDYPIFHHVTVF